MVQRIYAPIKHQYEWTREIREKLKKALRDNVWSRWKRVTVKGEKVKRSDKLSGGLLVDLGILYWAGGMMKVKRPTPAYVSLWLRENLDVRNDVVYGGLSHSVVERAQKMKSEAYERMVDYMGYLGSDEARRVVDEVNIDREVKLYIDRVRREIRSSVGDQKELDNQIKWNYYTSQLIDNIKHEVASSGVFEVERFKDRGLELLESSNTQELENWFGVRYAGSVMERRVDIRVESEGKKAQVEAMGWFLPESGFQYYMWTTKKDSKVRPDHARLEGRIINWNDPPVVDLRSGRRRHPGEDYNCYEKNTEVYTKDGFKLIKDVMIGEEILTLNPTTQGVEWGKCISKVEKHCDKIAHIHGQMFDLKVDPNHSFFVYKDVEHGRNQHKMYGTKIWYTREPQFRIGIESLSKTCNFYRSSKWVGEDKGTIKIGELEIPTEDYCKLMGYYLSEGNIDRREDRNGIKISQIKYLDKMFEDLAFFNPRKGKEAIWIFNTELNKYLGKFGYAIDKYVPDEIKKLDKRYIRIFLEAYALGDGTPSKKAEIYGRNCITYNCYRTGSKKMAHDLAECVIKAGMGVSIYLKKTKGKEIKFRNGTYKLNVDLYTIQELKSLYNSAYGMKKEIVEYNDSVYDIEVDRNHTLLIKSGKCIHWNGNCRCEAAPLKE